MKKNQRLICLLGCLLAAAGLCGARTAPGDLGSAEAIAQHLRDQESEPEDTLELLRALHSKSAAGDKAGVEPELASLAGQLLQLAATANDSNCTLLYFNHLGRLSSQARDYPSIGRLIDKIHSNQLFLCHQKNPRFSAYLAMNAAPHYLNF